MMTHNTGPDEQSVLSRERTELSRDRTRLANERTELSRNRTRLANKRTYLAWCRTALAVMTFGFLLEKIDVFLASGHGEISKTVLGELGMLGKFAFICGPILMVFAGVRYYRLEKEVGFSKHDMFIFPELFLFCIILGGVFIYLVL